MQPRFVRAREALTNRSEVVIGLRESDSAFADVKPGDADMRTERLGDGPVRIGSLFRTSVAISSHAEYHFKALLHSLREDRRWKKGISV